MDQELAEYRVRPYLPLVEMETWSNLLVEILPRVKLGPLSSEVNKVFESSDKASDLGAAIRKYPDYKELILAVVRAKKPDLAIRDEANACVALGMLNTRNIVCSTELWQRVYGEFPEQGHAAEITSFAEKTENASQLFQKSRPLWAYSSGLIWDSIRENMSHEEDFTKDDINWLSSFFKKILVAARMAHILATYNSQPFLFQKMAFASTLLSGAGFAMMNFLAPGDYREFLANSQSLSIPQQAIQLSEEAWLGANHCQMASLVACINPNFRDFVPSLMCVSHPETIQKEANANEYQLGALIHSVLNVVLMKEKKDWQPIHNAQWDNNTLEKTYKQAAAGI
jgi:hypothetical protein